MNKNYYQKLALSYTYYLLCKKGFNVLFVNNSNIDLFINSKKALVSYSLKTEHKTKKNNNEYIYNIWELNYNNIKEVDYDYLILVILENIEKEINEIGIFIFPKKIINKNLEKKTLTIFESDISGNYKKEPKFNKNFYFNNFTLIS